MIECSDELRPVRSGGTLDNAVTVLFAVSLLGIAGCVADEADAARARGAHDFQCSADRVRVHWLRTTDMGEAYEVYACGETAKYICDDGCRRADVQHTLSIRNDEHLAPPRERQSHVPVASPSALPLGYVGGTSSDSLLLFGGDGHRIFLGCLDCSEFDSASVHNEFGDYGSKFSDKSIFNKFGDFGSPYSPFSACNPMADDPPLVVEKTGHVRGRLTLNRAREPLDVPMIIAWLAGICER